MKIKSGAWKHGAEASTFNVPVIIRGQDQQLWLRVAPRLLSYCTVDALDGFVAALLPTALELGEDIEVEGPMSAQLCRSMNEQVIPLLTSPIGRFQKAVRVSAMEYCEIEPQRGRLEIAMGFSGGIDSFAALATLLDRRPPAGPKLGALVFNNFSRRRFSGGAAIISARNRVAALAKELAVEFVEIESNIAELNAVPFARCHTLLNAGGALMLQNLAQQYGMASGTRYEAIAAPREEGIAVLDPVLLPMLSTSRMSFLSLANRFSRPERTQLAVQVPSSVRYLDVCTEQGSAGKPNCGKCKKCLRTLATLEALGALELYQSVFDLEAYGRWRNAYRIKMLMSHDYFFNELRALRRARGDHVKAVEVLLGLPRYGMWIAIEAFKQARRLIANR